MKQISKECTESCSKATGPEDGGFSFGVGIVWFMVLVVGVVFPSWEVARAHPHLGGINPHYSLHTFGSKQFVSVIKCPLFANVFSKQGGNVLYKS